MANEQQEYPAFLDWLDDQRALAHTCAAEAARLAFNAADAETLSVAKLNGPADTAQRARYRREIVTGRAFLKLPFYCEELRADLTRAAPALLALIMRYP